MLSAPKSNPVSSFFPTDPAPSQIYTLSLHDALPIYRSRHHRRARLRRVRGDSVDASPADRKSTRLNSSHGYISYGVFCLKKKKTRATSVPTSRQEEG